MKPYHSHGKYHKCINLLAQKPPQCYALRFVLVGYVKYYILRIYVDVNGVINARTIETIQSVIKRMFIHTGAELHYQMDAITTTRDSHIEVD